MSAEVPVWIVDDRAAFRRIVAATIAASAGFVVAGEAATGEAALELLDPGRAGLVLMDINMPGIGGIEATRRISCAHPGMAVLLMSTYDTSDLPDEVSRCGAAGYVHKEALSPDLIATVWRRLSRSP